MPANGSREVHLLLRMGGCESLSARAGSFASSVLVRTERLGHLDRVGAGEAARGAPHRLAARGVLPELDRGVAATGLTLTAVSDSR